MGAKLVKIECEIHGSSEDKRYIAWATMGGLPVVVCLGDSDKDLTKKLNDEVANFLLDNVRLMPILQAVSSRRRHDKVVRQGAVVMSAILFGVLLGKFI